MTPMWCNARSLNKPSSRARLILWAWLGAESWTKCQTGISVAARARVRPPHTETIVEWGWGTVGTSELWRSWSRWAWRKCRTRTLSGEVEEAAWTWVIPLLAAPLCTRTSLASLAMGSSSVPWLRRHRLARHRLQKEELPKKLSANHCTAWCISSICSTYPCR